MLKRRRGQIEGFRASAGLSTLKRRRGDAETVTYYTYS